MRSPGAVSVRFCDVSRCGECEALWFSGAVTRVMVFIFPSDISGVFLGVAYFPFSW